jgi:hypothetical protein
MSQIDKIIDGLLARTEMGFLKWEDSVEIGKYRTRMGDYALEIVGSTGGLLPNISLTIQRLDGKLVEKINTNAVYQQPKTIGDVTSRASPQISIESRKKLETLFEILKNKNNDLDDLLKMLI